MQKGLVSVIVPNYNYAGYLGAAIESALGQTYSTVEIIVIDDGSTDGSKAVIESYGRGIKAIFQQNQGVAAARNNGVKAGRGEFVAFLDADDMWLPEKIERQVERFTEDPDLGLVHVGLTEIDQAGNSLAVRLGGGEGSEVWKDLLLFSPNGILGGGSGAMIPRSVFDALGGFDERLSTSADWDLYFRTAIRYAVGFVAEPLLKYRVHSSNMHSNIAVMERDMTLAYEKAFAKTNPRLQEIKGRAIGALHQNLSGSFFVAGNYGRFLLHSVKSLAANPSNIVHFLKIPKRRNAR